MINLGELQKRMSQLKGWSLEGSSFIVKDVELNSAKEAIEFVNKVAEIAEKHNHHPSMLIDMNRVRLTLTTHSESSLTLKDFDVADDIDKLG